MCEKGNQKNVVTDRSRVPDKSISVNQPEDPTNPVTNIREDGFEATTTPEVGEKKPSVTINLEKVPEPIEQIVIGKNVKTAVIEVTKKDGTTEKRTLQVDEPIVIGKLSPADQDVFKDAKSVKITPVAPTFPSDKTYKITVDITICERKY